MFSYRANIYKYLNFLYLKIIFNCTYVISMNSFELFMYENEQKKASLFKDAFLSGLKITY